MLPPKNRSCQYPDEQDQVRCRSTESRRSLKLPTKSILSICILMMCICSKSDAQTKHDSLYQIYESTDNQLEKGFVLEQLFVSTMFSDFDTSRYYVDKLLELGRENDLDTLVKIGYKRLSTHYLVISKYEASDSISRLLDPMIDPDDITDLAQQHYMNRGSYYYLTNQYALAAEQFIKVRKICEETDNKIGITSASTNIGNCFKQIDDHDKALEYFLPAYDHLMSISDTIPKLIALCTNIGVSYIKKGERELGKDYIIQSLEVAEKNDRYLNICLSSNNLATYLIEDNNLPEAKKYLDRSLVLSKEKELWREYISALKTMGLYYLKSKNYEQSIGYLSQALDTAKEKNISSLDKSIYDNLYKANQGRGDYKKALNNLLIVNELKDSIFSKEKAKEIQELNIQYETALKEAEITKQESQIQKIKSRQSLLSISSGLLGLLAVSIFLFMRKIMKTKSKIADQEALLQTQKISQLQKEKKILAMNAMIEGQEAERMRIAKDLHDGLGGLLSTVKARLTNINTEVKKIESYNIYEKTTSMVDEACDEVRRISHNLLPGALRLDGLKTAAQQLGEELDEAHPFDVTVEVIGFEGKMDETKEIFLYRIIQEATNNIIKYADAKNVLIQLSETEDEYHLIIEDDGKGFDIDKTMEGTGLGLKSIRSRVEHLRGELDISGTIGEGSTLTIHIPKTSTNQGGDEN